jgi:hypothetical protein
MTIFVCTCVLGVSANAVLQSLVNTNVVTHHVALKVLTQEQHLSHLADALVLDPEIMQLLKAL